MTIEDWLAAACEDADRRSLPELKPLLASLADATRDLRSVDWDAAAPPETGTSAGAPPETATSAGAPPERDVQQPASGEADR
jgi:hypothetical protein